MLILLRLISPASSRRGKEIYFSKPRILIGRSEECDVRPACFEVSRQHCQLTIDEDRVFVRDLNSANGTFVGEQQVTRPREVKHGEVLRIGTLHLELEIQDEDSPKPDGSNLDEGGILNWMNEFADEAELKAATQTVYHRDMSADSDHELQLTKVIGNAIDSYVGRHPNVPTQQVRSVLQQLCDALDESGSASNRADQLPRQLVENWERLSEPLRAAVLAIVDSAQHAP